MPKGAAKLTVLAAAITLLTAGSAYAETRIYSNPAQASGAPYGQRWIREPTEIGYAAGPGLRTLYIELVRIDWSGWGEQWATATAVMRRREFIHDHERWDIQRVRLRAGHRVPDAIPGGDGHAYRSIAIRYDGGKRWALGLPIPSR